MTWQEFKDTVDEKLQEMGVGSDAGIWYIDISYNGRPIDVSYDVSDGISVSS